MLLRWRSPGLLFLFLLIASFGRLAAQVGPARFLYIPGGASNQKSGDTLQLTAQEFFFSNATQTTAVRDVTNEVAWTIAPSSTVTATVSSHGLVKITGSAAGVVYVQARSGPILATKPINVAGISSIALTPTPAVTVALGNVKQMTATATFTDTSTGDITGLVTWNSVNTTDVPISSSGVISIPKTAAVGAGCTAGVPAAGCSDVTATFAAKTSGITTVTAGAAVLENITVNPLNSRIFPAAGGTRQLTANGHYSDGTTVDLSSAAGTIWSTGNSGIVTVSTTGLATGVTSGTTTVMASNSSILGSTFVNVGITAITVAPANASIAKGLYQSYTATATYNPSIGNPDVTGAVNWTSSNTSVATMGVRPLHCTGPVFECAFGVAVGGPVNVTASSSALTSAAATLNVTAATLSSITLSPANASKVLGKTATYVATGHFTDGSTQNLTSNSGLAFGSSDITVATVSNAADATKGVATTRGPGGPITISATCDNTCSGGVGPVLGMTNLTVTQATLSSISVTPKNQAIANASANPPGSKQYTATGAWSDNFSHALPYDAVAASDPNHVSAPMTWLMQDRAVATISNCTSSCGAAPFGFVNAVLFSGNGFTTVLANSGTLFGVTGLTVGAVVTSIAVTPQAAIMPLGSTQQMTAMGTLSNGDVQDITESVTWALSSCGNGNSINNAAGSEGVLTGAVANNSCLITATDPSTSVVSPAASVAIKAINGNITVTPGSKTLSVGQTQQYTAMASYTGGPPGQDISMFVAWSASPKSFADVDSASGLATALSVGGPTTITAQVGAVSGMGTLTVSVPVLVSVTVTPAAPSIQTNASQQFAATANFSDGSTTDVTNDPATLWSSDNTSVASVGDLTVPGTTPGLASAGKGPGTANISAQYTNNSVTQTGSTALTVHF